MSRERAKILKMVAEGTITPEDAEKLLAHLDGSGTTTATLADPTAGKTTPKTGPLKYLRVVVDGPDRVNIRVPIGLIRTGIKLTTIIPRQASAQLTEHGIDLSRFNNLDGDELTEALRELNIEVNTEDGEVVRIFCE